MNTSAESTAKEAGQKVIERALKERRRFRRVHVAITGRLYIPATQEEALCTVEDISPGDACIQCELQEEPRGRAVIYLDTLGRFEGPVVRARNGGFVMFIDRRPVCCTEAVNFSFNRSEAFRRDEVRMRRDRPIRQID